MSYIPGTYKTISIGTASSPFCTQNAALQKYRNDIQPYRSIASPPHTSRLQSTQTVAISFNEAIASSTRIFVSIDFNELCGIFAVLLFIFLAMHFSRLFSISTSTSFPGIHFMPCVIF